MTRSHQILIGALVLQLILAVAAFWPRTPPATAGAPLLGPIKPEEITSLTIYDDKGASVRLAKPNDKWVLPEADDFPADAAKITPILTKLVGIKNSRLIAKTANSHGRLQVADNAFVRRVEVRTSGGLNQTLYLGSSSGGSVHVRLGSQSDVYLASGLSTWEINADAGSWIDTAYLTIPLDDVVALTLSNANGQFNFTRDAQGAWTTEALAAGETFDPGQVTSLLSSVAALRMTRPLGRSVQPAYGMAQPNAVVTLRARKDNQEKTYTLTIGAKDAQESAYTAKSSDSPYYVRVAEWAVRELVEKTREGFLKLPPTPPLPAPPVPTPKS
ncbi:MAG: DUF4340 domain-containing protein [Chloroflexi bacterium]|nr:DUF4340 domain-containing protein [Chloroflexota bacterium]